MSTGPTGRPRATPVAIAHRLALTDTINGTARSRRLARRRSGQGSRDASHGARDGLVRSGARR